MQQEVFFKAKIIFPCLIIYVISAFLDLSKTNPWRGTLRVSPRRGSAGLAPLQSGRWLERPPAARVRRSGAGSRPQRPLLGPRQAPVGPAGCEVPGGAAVGAGDPDCG